MPQEYGESLRELFEFLEDIDVLSFPVVSALDAMISIALKLKLAFADEEGAIVIDEENPSIRFFYNERDELGNPLSVHYRTRVPRIHDEELSKFFNSLTKILARLKRKVLALSPLEKQERVRQNRRLYRDVEKFYQRMGKGGYLQ